VTNQLAVSLVTVWSTCRLYNSQTGHFAD